MRARPQYSNGVITPVETSPCADEAAPRRIDCGGAVDRVPPRPKESAIAGMDLKELKKLISLMNENGLVEIEISEEGRRCVLKKAPPQLAGSNSHGPVEVHLPMRHEGAASHAAPGPAGKAAGGPLPLEGTVTFNSPIVGTFYRSPSPGVEPFVKAGDRINADSVLCLIEAMKVFNEIKAEMTGTIVEVLVENQEAVEFNQPLFLIKP